MYIDGSYYLLNSPGFESKVASWQTSDDAKSYLQGYLGEQLKRVREVIIPSLVEIDGLSELFDKLFGEQPPEFTGTEFAIGGRIVNVIHINQDLAKQAWLDGERERFH
jgi:hypothetical protein